MPTVAERLKKVIDTYTPSRVKFKAEKISDGTLILKSIRISEMSITQPLDDEALHKAFEGRISEYWCNDGYYVLSTSVDDLWQDVKNTVTYEYSLASDRCDATKRKTTNFIYHINDHDKHLANYLLQTFIDIKVGTWVYKSISEKQALFETFEGLRRTYGKRK